MVKNNARIAQYLIIVIFGITILALAMVCSAREEKEFKQVHINMKADDIFSPEYNHRGDADHERRSVEADCDEYGNIKTNRQYVDVGTWESYWIRGNLTLKGTIRFNLWFKERDDGYDNNPDWQFELQYNGV